MSKPEYDLIIIGGGPAGLTAGLYASRSRLKTLMIEKLLPGGQIRVSDALENYPGFPDTITGAELAQRMTEQAGKFGLEIETNEVLNVDFSKKIKKISLPDKNISAPTVIIATGASPRKLNVPGEEIFLGKGVSFCATCDGPFFHNSVVAAVGGGDTAVQESIFLTKFAKKVYIIHRRDELRATKILQERAFANDKIEFIWDSVVTGIKGGLTNVDTITLKNIKTNDSKDLNVDGCFIWVGTRPNIEFLENALELDKDGFIVTDSHMRTSVAGVFAAGDIRNTPLRQVATAVGDAAIAAFSAEHYITNL